MGEPLLEINVEGICSEDLLCRGKKIPGVDAVHRTAYCKGDPTNQTMHSESLFKLGNILGPGELCGYITVPILAITVKGTCAEGLYCRGKKIDGVLRSGIDAVLRTATCESASKQGIPCCKYNI